MRAMSRFRRRGFEWRRMCRKVQDLELFGLVFLCSCVTIAKRAHVEKMMSTSFCEDGLAAVLSESTYVGGTSDLHVGVAEREFRQVQMEGSLEAEGDDEEAEDEDSVSFSSHVSCVADCCCGDEDVGEREYAQVQMAREEVTVGASLEADGGDNEVEDDLSLIHI